jgi:hypothetical protein
VRGPTSSSIGPPAVAGMRKIMQAFRAIAADLA